MSFTSQEEINTTDSFQDGSGGNFEDPSSTASITQTKGDVTPKPEQKEKIIDALRHRYKSLKPHCVLDYNAAKKDVYCSN